ncbi:hypothetical protein [Flavisericum labens]|uniref:hypothetical protein n=1 Tax=Flavisericum labens TaxID=3377112 RepID=UPI00387A892B
MKNLKLLFVFGSLICLLAACEKPQDIITEDNLTELNISAKKSNQMELPFKAKLFTGQAEDALTEICSFTSPTDFWGLEHQVGGGNATHLGNFTTDMTFCFHVVLDNQGVPDFLGGFGVYEDVEGYMEAANGDRVFFTGPGSSLVPIQDEEYMFAFEDICYINGGTGRYENASGEFNINSLVRIDGTGTDHNWEGTITLNNGKAK